MTLVPPMTQVTPISPNLSCARVTGELGKKASQASCVIQASCDLVQAALKYAKAGWPVLPLAPRGKVPLCPHGVHDASTDPAQVCAWWTRWPAANVGLAMGRGRLVLDVDGDAGLESLIELQREHGEFPATLTAQTGGGGMHLVFASGVPVRNAVRFCAGLDTRGDGGYIVAAPSVHASGRVYRWINRVRPAPAPSWLVDLVRVPEISDTTPRVSEISADRVVERARRYVAAMPPAISGSGGHAATWRVAVVLVRGFGLGREAALSVLHEYNGRCEPGWGRRALEHKIDSALRQSRLPSGYLLEASA